MKKSRFLLMSVCLILIAFLACQPEQIQAPLPSNDPDLFYNNSMLNTAAIALLDLSKDPEFKDLVYEKVAERFDDDDNVLLKTLFEQKGEELKNEMLSSLQRYSANLNSENQTRFRDFEAFTTPDEVDKTINGFPAGAKSFTLKFTFLLLMKLI